MRRSERRGFGGMIRHALLAAAAVTLVACPPAHDLVGPQSSELPAASIAFCGEPADLAAGETLGGPVRVCARDVNGALTDELTAAVTVTLGTNPSAGTLNGTTTKPAADGVAVFDDLWIDKAGEGYTLVAMSGGLTSAATAAFDVVPARAVRMGFRVHPTDVVEGDSISPPVQVAVVDTFDNVVTIEARSVTLELIRAGQPAADDLLGLTTQVTQAGVATFQGLRVTTSRNAYHLVAVASGLAADTSDAFDVLRPAR